METIKNFLAMIFASFTWFLGVVILFSIYSLFAGGPSVVEGILVMVFMVIFGCCLLAAKYNERIRVALEFPFGLTPG